MAIPLLKTKFYRPPVRKALVSREHLLDRLTEGVDKGHKLTLVSAPAGFGKSTLLSDYATTGRYPVAWLALDDEDNDEARFWTYTVTALQMVALALQGGGGQFCSVICYVF